MPLKDKNKAYTMLNHAGIKPNSYFTKTVLKGNTCVDCLKIVSITSTSYCRDDGVRKENLSTFR